MIKGIHEIDKKESGGTITGALKNECDEGNIHDSDRYEIRVDVFHMNIHIDKMIYYDYI